MMLLPGVGLGYLAAPAIARFVNNAVFRVAILTVSSVSAAALLVR